MGWMRINSSSAVDPSLFCIWASMQSCFPGGLISVNIHDRWEGPEEIVCHTRSIQPSDQNMSTIHIHQRRIINIKLISLEFRFPSELENMSGVSILVCDHMTFEKLSTNLCNFTHFHHHNADWDQMSDKLTNWLIKFINLTQIKLILSQFSARQLEKHLKVIKSLIVIHVSLN